MRSITSLRLWLVSRSSSFLSFSRPSFVSKCVLAISLQLVKNQMNRTMVIHSALAVKPKSNLTHHCPGQLNEPGFYYNHEIARFLERNRMTRTEIDSNPNRGRS